MSSPHTTVNLASRDAARPAIGWPSPRRRSDNCALPSCFRRLALWAGRWLIFLASALNCTGAAAQTGLVPDEQSGSQTQLSAEGGFCAPPALGAPCARGGIATLGQSEPAPGFSLGNPVHLASGNKYQLEVDLPPNASAPGLELIRHYNGLSIHSGALGRNWTLSYDTRLQRRGDGWQLRQADGSIRKISPPLPSGTGFTWSWPDGRQLQFDMRGDLVGIRTGRAALVHIDRHAGPHPLAGLIARVESAAGHALEFHYEIRSGRVLLKAVDTPLGRFHYRYSQPPADSAQASYRLEAIMRPDGLQRLYHYEAEHQSGNAYALTGISLQADGAAAQRLASWRYDRHGRVVSLRQHGQALPAMHVDYLRSASGTRPGITEVRSDNGLRRHVRFQRLQDGYRLLSRNAGPHGEALSTATYDTSGRLASLSGLQLQRTSDGALAGLVPHARGWPGLAFELQPGTGRYLWRSQATGATVLTADQAGRPALLQYANGDSLRLQRDAQGRPVSLQYSAGEPSRHYRTRLQWRARQLRRIEHPFETETRHYDTLGRVTQRLVQRPALFSSAAARFQEIFHYDTYGRLQRHGLPEGGALHYSWHDGPAGGALAALHWENAQGQLYTVVSSTEGRPGYRYGNGLELFTGARNSPHADTLLLMRGEHLVWRQQRRYDEKGRVLQDQHEFPLAGHYDQLLYTHDEQSRLKGARHQRPGSTTRWWYAWHDDGRLAAVNHDGHSRVAAIRRDPSGLPLEAGTRSLRYGPQRRLETVSQAGTGQVIAQYRHNAFGHRIIKQTAAGVTHYLYLNDRLVAEARSSNSSEPPTVTRRYLYAGLTPVGMIDYPPDGPPRLYAVHADLSGVPRMVTDAGQELCWLASYTPTGQAEQVAGELRFALRLPGQHADEETGWYDNLLRTYAADSGHYLEPDPLGPLPGTDTYGYARQQPWRYADPHGLLLFVFDGTRYSADSMSNAWILAQAYRDGPAHYHSGPGNSLFLDWDAIVAWQAGRILENQWQALLTSLEQQPAGAPIPVDIIGFSRGAALARHFGNRIASHMQDGLFSVDDPMRGRITACVDLRFMGLFDTVAQFGIAGSHNHLYDFGITELWSWVSHAVALHEHRWAFPLTSADAGGSGNVVEAPFVGAHADIGGGLALHSPPSQAADGPVGHESGQASPAASSDLAKVALGWMHWQAMAASVDFDTLSEADTTLRSPLLRDMRSPLSRSLQQGDRAVTSASGSPRLSYQDDDPRLGRQARSQVETFITRAPDWRKQSGDVVGTVDMEGYSRWLEETLGWAPQ